MATRVNRKNVATTSSKEVVTTDRPSRSEVVEDVTKSNTIVNKSAAKIVGKKIVKKSPTKLIKKPGIGIKLKAKAKRPNRLAPKLTKGILQNSKSVEGKKKLLNNGVKQGRPVRKKTLIKKEKDDTPPVLEPIFPIEENLEVKKTKKRIKKLEESTENTQDLLDTKKIKIEDDDISLCSDVTDVSNTDIPSLKKQVRKRGTKKIKVENESIEDVMNDLSFLIKKEEPDCMTESGKSDVKPKKMTRKQKIELLKQDENLEGETMDTIPMLIKKEDVKNEVVDSMSESGKSDIIKSKKLLKKQKFETVVGEAVDDFPMLIKKEDIKSEIDSMSESGKSDILKTKKLSKKQRIDLLTRKIIKNENIENTLNKLDSSEKKIIDMLDLNVRNIKRNSPLSKRRHSIEKCPIGSIESSENSIAQLFNHLPRSFSPRSKRSVKVRQSIDGISRRASPYSTRSDSSAKLLRNGKQRKLKDMNLLDGLDIDPKKRRRICSDLSESEMSKNSGYESDSSFSDLASLHGAEIADDTLKIEDIDKKPLTNTAQNGPISNLGIIDTNSNVCNNVNEKVNLKPQQLEMNDEADSSSKLPEKKALLDIMKQAFNEVNKESTKSNKINTVESQKSNFEPVLAATFYGKEKSSQESTTEKHVGTSVTIEAPVSTLDNTTDLQNIVTSEQVTPTSNLPQETIDTEKNQTNNNDKETMFNDIKELNGSPTLSDIAIGESVKNFLEQEELLNNKETNENIAENSKEVPSEESNLIEDSNEFIDSDDLPAPTLEKLESLPEQLNPEENPPELIALEQLGNSTKPPEVFKETLISNAAEDENGEDMEVEDNLVTEQKYEEMTEHGDLEASDVNMTEVINTNLEDNSEETIGSYSVEESAEELAEKESILKALGLQSLRAAEQAKQKTTRGKSSKSDSYTGTLKTVIKINRDKKKGNRSGIKMTLQKNKSKGVEEEQSLEDENYKIMKEGPSSSAKQGSHSSDTAGAHRKTHYSNRSNMDGSSEHTSDGEGTSQDGTIKALVIPEKASSFSIHPGRLCKDECSYCFGKFGLFDTPCHIAQMKSVERQDKILASEKHLTRDSCLCDACYRHVDRKSNTPSYMNKSLKRSSLVAPGPRQNHCHVLGCNKVSTNILRRKWIIKMRKSVCQAINIDLDNPGLHSIPICSEHYSALEHLMVCAMCKRRLARNHVHYLGPEVAELNEALSREDVPLRLTDRPVVCKLCKCFASIILKDPEERLENSVNFFKEYKKRLLHFNDIVPMDEAAAEEPIAVPTKPEKPDQIKKKKKLSKSDDLTESLGSPENIQERLPSSDTNSQPQSRSESPNEDYNGIDYNTLIPAIAMECDSDSESRKDEKKPVIIKRVDRPRMISDAVEICKIIKPQSDKCKNADIAVQKLGANPSISVRQLFPGEEDLPLNVHVDFNNIKERTPEGWEKCTSLIQYDAETKRLWQELQKPYGNQSSFLRHLILLEKYFRNGDLVLSPRASHHSINYSESVHNRLRAYDNIPTSAGNIQPLSMIQFNKMYSRSSSGIVTTASGSSTSTNQSASITSVPKSFPNPITITPTNTNSNAPKAPLTISQLNSPPLIPAPKTILEGKLSEPNTILQQVRPKVGAPPPGLISLHPGTTRPMAPVVKAPQSQRIKFPITKNWRPNLIPIDPNQKPERKAGLVQVISAGKPYHITLEDYKKMCAIKRSFEMKQKKLLEAQNTAKPILVTHNSVLKSITPRKGLIISKTTIPKNEPFPPSTESNGDSETILEKLDKQVEKLESKLNEKSSSLLLPKIPKSLTVIPQTVTKKPSRPSSPILQITPKSASKS